MKLLRTAAALAALFVATQASAGVASFLMQGTLDSPSSDLAATYPSGTAFSGYFHVQTTYLPSTSMPGYQGYDKVVDGTVLVNGKSIDFQQSYAYLWDDGQHTQLTVLGGDAWNTGGWVHENDATPDDIQGVQIMLTYPSGILANAPIPDILQNYKYTTGSIYLNYGGGSGVWGTVTLADNNMAVPEPGSVLLMGLGIAGLLAGRRLRLGGAAPARVRAG